MAAPELFAAARAAMDKAYTPYSAFPVGAALKTAEGGVYSGCNIENTSYPEGWCAETTALGAFVMDGGGTITEIAIVSERLARIMPCGGCRQRLSEFTAPDARLHLCSMDGIVETIAFSDIFPRGFSMDGER